jgi:hypothetical protein
MTVRASKPHGKAPRGSRQESARNDSAQEPILTQRAALILTAALVIAAAAGVLGYLARRNTADAVLTGGAAFAGAIALLIRLIG